MKISCDLEFPISITIEDEQDYKVFMSILGKASKNIVKENKKRIETRVYGSAYTESVSEDLQDFRDFSVIHSIVDKLDAIYKIIKERD